MNISTICTIAGTVFASVSIFIAVRQYLHDKDAAEQARSIAVYSVKLFDKANNKWVPLKIAEVGQPPLEDGSNNTESMAYGLVIENGSNQPIFNFSATIDKDAAKNCFGSDNQLNVLSDFGDAAPLATLPPGKWFVNMDITSRPRKGIMINSVDEILAFEEAEVAFNPIVRAKSDPIISYSFQDSMMHWWVCNRGDKRGIHKCSEHKADLS